MSEKKKGDIGVSEAYEIMDADPIHEIEDEVGLYAPVSTSTPEHEAMRILYLHSLGYSQSQIAMHYKMSAKRVRELMKSEEFRLLAQEYTKNTTMMAKLSLSMVTEKAMSTLIGLLDSKSEKVRLATAKDILDRAGLVTKQTVQFTENTGLGAMDDDHLLDVVSKSMQDILSRRDMENGNNKGTTGTP